MSIAKTSRAGGPRRPRSGLLAGAALLVLFGFYAGGCLPATRGAPAVGGDPGAWRARVPELEERLRTDPQDADVLGNLAIAYVFAARPSRAESTAVAALRVRPGDGRASYALALVHEDRGEFEAADAIYRQRDHLDPITPELRRLMQTRHTIVSRRILREAARTELARANAGRERPPQPLTLVVRRFLPLSAGRRDSVLAVGVTHYLTQTFAQIDTLTVIDDTRRALLEAEIQRSGEDVFDPQSRLTARALQAGLALSGRSGVEHTDEDEVRVQLDVVDLVLPPESDHWRGTPAPVSLVSPTRYLLADLGRQVAEIAETRLQVTLDEELRTRLLRPPTESFAAFMAYAEGLTYEGRGAYREAFERYREAARLDPGFGWAADAAGRTSGAGSGGAALPPSPAGPRGGGQEYAQEAAERAGTEVDEFSGQRAEDPVVTPSPGERQVRIVVRPR